MKTFETLQEFNHQRASNEEKKSAIAQAHNILAEDSMETCPWPHQALLPVFQQVYDTNYQQMVLCSPIQRFQSALCVSVFPFNFLQQRKEMSTCEGITRTFTVVSVSLSDGFVFLLTSATVHWMELHLTYNEK